MAGRPGIRAKLSAALLLAVVLAAAASAWVAVHVYGAFSEDTTHRELVAARRTVQAVLDLRQEAALGHAEVLAQRDDVRAAIVARDREALVRLGRRFQQEQGLDVVVITDAAGVVLARGHAPAQYGDDASEFVTVRGALHGLALATIRRAPIIRLGTTGGAPVFERRPPYRVMGTVTAGFGLGQSFVADLKKTIGFDVSFILDGARHVTTLPGSHAPHPAALAAAGAPGETPPVDLRVGREEYRAVYAALRGRDSSAAVGGIEIAKDLSGEKAARARVVWTIACAVSLLSLGILGIGLWLSARITGPLNRLMRAAGGVGSGDLGHRVQVDGDDEVGRLALAFNQMAEGIQRAQAEVSASEERYRDLYENAPSGYLSVAGDGRITQCNLAMVALLGVGSPQDLIGRPVMDLWADTPSDRERAVALARRLYAGEDLPPQEVQIRREDGSAIWVTASVSATRDPDGAVVLFHGSVVDITEHKRGEAALRESETRYRSLFDNMVEGLAYCRMLFEDGQPQDFIYLDVNEAFHTLTGLKNVVGRNVSEVIPGIRESNPELFDRYGRVSLTGQPERFETYVAALKMWLSISVYCPEKEHFVAVFDVITKRKRAEEEIKNLAKFPSENPNPVLRLDPEGVVLYANDTGQLLLHEWGCAVGDNAPKRWCDLTAQVLLNGASQVADVECGEKAYSFVVAPIAEAGYVNLYGRDITERKRAEEQREGLARVASGLTGSLDVSEVGPRIVNSVVPLLRAHSAGLSLLHPDGSLETLAVSDPPGLYLAPGEVLPAGVGISARVIASRQAESSADLLAEPDLVVSGSLRRRIEESGEGARLAVPLRAGGQVIGVLSVADATGRQFSEAEATMLQTFADQAAIAIANARLYDQVKASGERLRALSRRLMEVQEAEQRGLARELHDELGQSLSALRITLETAQGAPGGGAASTALAEAIRLADEVLGQVRDLSLHLRPSVLDDLGLVPALRWYLQRQRQRTGLDLRLEADLGEIRLPPGVETACFRVAQEALTNAARHSGASRVEVLAALRDGEVLLIMRDDGRGFDVDAARARARHGESLGLLGMEERVVLLGGRIDIVSAAGRGTEISVRLPLAGEPDILAREGMEER